MIKFSTTLKQKYSSWVELEKAIEALPSTTEKGNAFEEFTYAYFKIKSNFYQIEEIFPYKIIPQKYKDKYRLAMRDSGVDGLIIRKDGSVVAYQSKFRSFRVSPTYEELTKFWSEGRYCDYCCTVANSYSISNLSDKHEQNMKILVYDFLNLPESFFNELYNFTNTNNLSKTIQKKPFEYQEKIISDVISKFKYEDRGKIIAACGTGKTLTALWIVEKMDLEIVLFLAPSISLIKQTLEVWSEQANIPFSYICICSDNTVSDNIENDESDISISELGIPVSTDEKEIAKYFQHDTVRRKYIFSTYQSTEKVVSAIKHAKIFIDLTIFDEAHRTAGLRSSFSLALENQYVPTKKRLFMTATERIVRPLLLRKAQNNGEIIFSMDDQNIYGPLFSKYNFGDAILDETIADYQIIIAGVKEKDIFKYIKENKDLSVKDMNEEEKKTTAQSLYAKILIAKSMSQFSIKKIISFHSTIKRARDFTIENNNEIYLKTIINEFNPHIPDESLYLNHISCNINSGERARILETFRSNDFSIVSNAKCLTEGVDVPLIDSIYFVDKKTSLVDIVQACGRALRTKKGSKKTAYFIIPILIPEKTISSEIFNLDTFETVYNIIQSLRDQDNRLADWIDHLNKKLVRGGNFTSSDEKPPIIIDIEGIDIKQFSEELYLQIATVNKDPLRDIYTTTIYGKGDRRTSQTRIFKTMGDYAFDSYINNLVLPTIELYKKHKKYILPSHVIKIDHNNISHTKKLGLIEKDGNNYILTPLGKLFLNGNLDIIDLFKRQLLRYSCSIEDGNDDRILFPYRAVLKIISELKEKKLSFFEFAFCIYPMYDSNHSSIIQSINDIVYFRDNYPNLELVSISNRKSILSELNEYYQTQISETDIWGTRPTTIKNQYLYFRNHLSLFQNIIEVRNQFIFMKNDIEKELSELLNNDISIEKENKQNLWFKYTQPFLSMILFSL